MTRLLLMTLAFVIGSSPAHAHLLKVFATVDGGAVSGYGFFIGGGRPEGAALTITNKDGRELYKGATDERGAFSWLPPQPEAMTVTIDAGDGHVAHSNLSAERFGLLSVSAGQSETAAAQAGSDAPAKIASQQSDQAQVGCVPSEASSNLNRLVASAVDSAVARQVRPLMEAYSEADGRARLSDVVGGIGMIFGLAGIAMWATARRRVRDAGADRTTGHAGKQEGA